MSVECMIVMIDSGYGFPRSLSVCHYLKKYICQHTSGFGACYYVAYVSLYICDHGWLSAMMLDLKFRLRRNLTVASVLSQRSDFVYVRSCCFKIVENVVLLYMCCFSSFRHVQWKPASITTPLKVPRF